MAAGIIILLVLCAAIAVPWVRGIERTKDEYLEHKDDPDYWDWP